MIAVIGPIVDEGMDALAQGIHEAMIESVAEDHSSSARSEELVNVDPIPIDDDDPNDLEDM
jgi:hypothetical protein